MTCQTFGEVALQAGSIVIEISLVELKLTGYIFVFPSFMADEETGASDHEHDDSERSGGRSYHGQAEVDGEFAILAPVWSRH